MVAVFMPCMLANTMNQGIWACFFSTKLVYQCIMKLHHAWIYVLQKFCEVPTLGIHILQMKNWAREILCNVSKVTAFVWMSQAKYVVGLMPESAVFFLGSSGVYYFLTFLLRYYWYTLSWRFYMKNNVVTTFTYIIKSPPTPIAVTVNHCSKVPQTH